MSRPLGVAPARRSCGLQDLHVMRKPEKKDRSPELEEQREVRREASRDEQLREQTKTETEQRPYLDTEGGE